ncbi:MAG: hypothetical protein ACLVIG_10055, partial [Sutterella wadsworthensis]
MHQAHCGDHVARLEHQRIPVVLPVVLVLLGNVDVPFGLQIGDQPALVPMRLLKQHEAEEDALSVNGLPVVLTTGLNRFFTFADDARRILILRIELSPGSGIRNGL